MVFLITLLTHNLLRGYIETPMTTLSDKIHDQAGKAEEKENELIGRVPLHRPGQPDEVAKLICFLLGDESKFITGAAYIIDGGFVA
jgi:NAD(P)-dependent dehydrogenase (short-subunit alcohol dehydrogenase family)